MPLGKGALGGTAAPRAAASLSWPFLLLPPTRSAHLPIALSLSPCLPLIRTLFPLPPPPPIHGNTPFQGTESPLQSPFLHIRCRTRSCWDWGGEGACIIQPPSQTVTRPHPAVLRLRGHRRRCRPHQHQGVKECQGPTSQPGVTWCDLGEVPEPRLLLCKMGTNKDSARQAFTRGPSDSLPLGHRSRPTQTDEDSL